MNPVSGRGAVQISTISSYLLTSLLHGEGLDLRRFAKEHIADKPRGSFFLTVNDVERLEDAVVAVGVDTDSEEFLKGPTKALVAHVLGHSFDMEKETSLRSEHEKAVLHEWYDKVKIWKHLKLAGFWLDGSGSGSNGGRYNSNSTDKRLRT